ncbi:hypothetical protein HDU87_004126 [Geranomyces variabilis]|uniref:AH domain-containing protein n=1 Tax=Geranomyces variabilis TaxID=109894 RepID=A0AAD5XUL2_9FUNG|nr:hypothetical protein HDU87_004126 [Geranomyces variabilis]
MTGDCETPYPQTPTSPKGEQQAWADDSRQPEVATRAPAHNLAADETHDEAAAAAVKETEEERPDSPVTPGPENALNLMTQALDAAVGALSASVGEEPVPQNDLPSSGSDAGSNFAPHGAADVNDEDDDDESEEEGALGSTILRHAEGVISEEPRSESPEYEPDVLPVLSIGLPARVSSLQLQQQRQLKRAASSPVISTARTDISAPELQTTELPTFATPTPMAAVRFPVVGDLGMGARTPPSFVSSAGLRDQGMPLSENSKSKQFNQRLDYMVGEFFTRQVSKIATSTPESVDRFQKIFSQRVREKLGQQMGKQWAHVTAQPEVDEAAKDIEAMHTYFSQLEKMVERQRSALQQLNEVEAELSLFYQQKGYQEQQEDISKNLIHLGVAYHQESKERIPVIGALDNYLAFLKVFKGKAIADSRDTIKLQKTARQEFDSYASRLGYLEEKNVRATSAASSSFNPLRSKSGEDAARYQEKELDQTRQRFQGAKAKYQQLSTQVIDKAGLLEMKRGVDFGAYVARVVEANDAYNARHFEAGKVGALGYYNPNAQPEAEREGEAVAETFETDAENASR